MKTPNYPSIVQFQQLVELKDYRGPTKKEYVRYVRKFAEHLQADPATATEDRLREYFLFLRQKKGYSRSPMNVAKCALRCFYRECLQVTGWTVFEELRIAQPIVLPLVLSRQEVGRLLDAVREARFRTCLHLMYHCGLRVSEAVRLEIRDLQNTRADQPRLHVRNGKGGKDRYVPMAPVMVAELRAWWKVHHNRTWLFPSPGRGWAERAHSLSEAMHRASEPMSTSAVQMALKLARAQSGTNPAATCHTLRHSYATHLLEEGVSLLQISRYLGHESLDTTVVYTHLTNVSEARTQAALGILYRRPPA
jgi:site-specific recombinase XerD